MDIKTANRLYELRKQHGYSQDELAELLDVSRQAVSKWERSESSPDTDNLIALAKLYNVSLDELLGYKAQGADEQNKESESKTDAQENQSDAQTETGDSTFDIHTDDGDHVHIDDNGIHIHDKDGSSVVIKGGIAKLVNKIVGEVEVDGTKATVNGKEYDCNSCHPEVEIKNGKIVVTQKEKSVRVINDCVWGVSFLLCTIAYLLMGFLAGLWHPGWILFLLPFVTGGLTSTILHRNPGEFPVVFLVTGAYLLMGFLAGLWHPGWVIFLLIPAYYGISEPIKRAVRKKNRIEINVGNVDDQSDDEQDDDEQDDEN